MPVTMISPALKGAASVASFGHGHGLSTKLALDCQIHIDRVTSARDKAAVLVAKGEFWAIPIFERLEIELAKLAAENDTIARARLIAEKAMASKAA